MMFISKAVNRDHTDPISYRDVWCISPSNHPQIKRQALFLPQLYQAVPTVESPLNGRRKAKILRQINQKNMNSATPFDVSGRSDEPRSKLKTTLSLFCKQWPYICKFTASCHFSPFFFGTYAPLTTHTGFSILLSLLTTSLSIWTMSYLHFKQERKF